MSVTQPPPSSVRRSRFPSKTSSTFFRRRRRRGASAVLPCRGLLGSVRRFRRFPSSAPFRFSSSVAARRLSDFVVIINAILSALLAFAEPTRRCAPTFRFDIPSFRRVFASKPRRRRFFPPRAFFGGAPFRSERRLARERVAATSFWEATRRPTYGETPK